MKKVTGKERATQPPWDMKLEKPMDPGKTHKPSMEEELIQMCGSTHTKQKGPWAPADRWHNLRAKTMEGLSVEGRVRDTF